MDWVELFIGTQVLPKAFVENSIQGSVKIAENRIYAGFCDCLKNASNDCF